MYHDMPVQQQYIGGTVRIPECSCRGCQNTAVVCAAGLRPYIYPRNIIYNVFLVSATISLFVFVEVVGLVSAHLLAPPIG